MAEDRWMASIVTSNGGVIFPATTGEGDALGVASQLHEALQDEHVVLVQMTATRMGEQGLHDKIDDLLEMREALRPNTDT